jgi:polyferredoxin
MLIEEIRNIKSGKKELREFGLLVGGVLGLIGLFAWWKGKPFFPYLLVPAIVLIVAGGAIPSILKPIQRVWMTAALLIGWVMTSILLSLLFYGVVTPLGILARLMGKDFLDLKFKENKHSYWIPRREGGVKKTNYERQF